MIRKPFVGWFILFFFVSFASFTSLFKIPRTCEVEESDKAFFV